MNFYGSNDALLAAITIRYEGVGLRRFSLVGREEFHGSSNALLCAQYTEYGWRRSKILWISFWSYKLHSWARTLIKLRVIPHNFLVRAMLSLSGATLGMVYEWRKSTILWISLWSCKLHPWQGLCHVLSWLKRFSPIGYGWSRSKILWNSFGVANCTHYSGP